MGPGLVFGKRETDAKLYAKLARKLGSIRMGFFGKASEWPR